MQMCYAKNSTEEPFATLPAQMACICVPAIDKRKSVDANLLHTLRHTFSFGCLIPLDLSSTSMSCARTCSDIFIQVSVAGDGDDMLLVKMLMWKMKLITGA